MRLTILSTIALLLLTACTSRPELVASPTPDPAEVAKQQQAEAEAKKQQDEERERIAKRVQPIFAKLEKQSGYKPQWIDWGGGKCLAIEAKSYYSLSKPERKLIADYARTQRLKAVIIGDKVDSDTIEIDTTVWGS